MMPMLRAELSAVLLIFVVGAYLFRHYGRPWWRTRSIQKEIDALPPIDYGRVRPSNNSIRLATLPELKELEMRAQARIVADAREANKLRLVVSGSSQRIH